MGAIYIMWLRQMKRYFRSRSRVIGALGQPLLFLLALGFGFGPIFQKAGQGNYINFCPRNYCNEHFVHGIVFRN